MTSMELIGNYFSYCIASAMLWSVILVVKVLSHLSGGEESDFPYLQTGGENSFHNGSNITSLTSCLRTEAKVKAIK